jgi:site-specific DNA-methyltransferase (adenine-specific)
MKDIYNNDCFDIFPLIKNKSVDLVLVDLPYGQTACHWDIKINLDEMWKELKRISKDNCQFVFFTTTKFWVEIINSNPKWFRYDLVWEKCNSVGFLCANKMPLRIHEMMYIFNKSSKGGKTYNPQKTPGKPYKVKGQKTETKTYGRDEVIEHANKTGDRHPVSVIKFHQISQKLHPTQKPLELCEWLIKTYSNEGDLVLDFCMGSGTTIEACMNTNRNYIGFEKDEKIFEVAKQRLCY